MITIRNSRTGQIAVEAIHDDNRLPVFSEDERYALTWSNGNAELFELIRARRIARFQSTRVIEGAEISSRGDCVLTWWQGGGAALWKGESGEKPYEIPDPATICGAAFNRENSMVLTWAGDGSMSIWDLERGRAPVRLSAGSQNLQVRSGGVVGARFSMNGDQVLTWNCGTSGALHIWDARNGRPIQLLEHRREVRQAVFSTDESRILSWSDDGTARIWSRETGRELCSCVHQGKVRGAVFNEDESLVLTWSEDGTARLWDSLNGQPITSSLRHEGMVRGGMVDHGGEWVTTWTDSTVRRLHVGLMRPCPFSLPVLQMEVNSGTRLKVESEVEILSSKRWLEHRGKLHSKLPQSANLQ